MVIPRLGHFKDSLLRKCNRLLRSIWNYCDIGREYEPAEYTDKPLLVWYDHTYTLPMLAHDAWKYVMDSSLPIITASRISRFAELAHNRKKAWLQRLSRTNVITTSASLQN